MSNTINPAEQRTVAELRASAYMGHKVISHDGHNLTWQMLAVMSPATYSVTIEGDHMNRIYKIQPPKA